METISIILIAIGLSMDSFAISISNGLTIKKITVKRILTIACSLALFQTLMPLIGWSVGIGVEKYIKEIDHWIAFLLLALIGLKMIYEGVAKRDHSENIELNYLILIGQSLSTSIDAFIVGISFALLDIAILKPILIIGVITLGFSLTGLQLGKLIGKRVGKSAEIIGGLVLFGIGVKILIEHLYFQ